MSIHLSLDDHTEKLKTILTEAKQIAEQQFFDIHISGRETSGEERAQREKLETCMGYIREALSVLERN